MPPRTRADIVAAALELVREVGVDGFTMRDLANRVGMALSAAYKHVPSKDALLQLAAAEVYSRVEVDTVDTVDGDWVDRLRSLMVRAYDTMSGYRGMSSYLLRDPEEVAELPVTSAIRQILLSAGFSRGQAQQVIATLYFYGTGALLGAADRVDPHGPLAAAVRTAYCRGLETVLLGIRRELEIRAV